MSVHIGTLATFRATKNESINILIIVLLVLRVLWHSYVMIRIKFLFPFITLRCGVWRANNQAIQKIGVAKAIQTIFQSAQIAVLTVARQQAHHKLSFGINFSPQFSTSGSGRQCHSDNRSYSDNAIQTLRESFFVWPQNNRFLQNQTFGFRIAIQTMRLLTL